MNTPGTEDSSTVSPDGEWLILGTYSPADILCCQGLCDGVFDGRSSYCQRSNGPVTAPARPGMPGAWRVLSPTRIRQVAPGFCLDNPDGGDVLLPLPDGGAFVFPNPPASAFGFRRQGDGTFAAPFRIALDADGIIGAPFCFTFLNSPDAGTADFIFGYQRTGLERVNRPFFATLTLGAPITLGTYSCVLRAPALSGFVGTALAVTPATQTAGNTSFSSGYLFSDDESVSPPFTIAARVTGNLPGASVGPWARLPVPAEGEDRRQPVVDGASTTRASSPSPRWPGAAPTPSMLAPSPSLATSWSPSSSRWAS